MVYFASATEQRHIERWLLPRLRRQGIADDLRGWSWPRPPLAPVYGGALGVSEIASEYCPSGRDVFLRNVEHLRPATDDMRRGQALHATVAGLLERTKRVIYVHGLECLPHLEEQLNEFEPPAGVDASELTTQHFKSLQQFQAREIAQRVAEALSRYPHIGADALAALSLPITAELRLDGRHLGLSHHLSADAVSFQSLTVFDLKFGRRDEVHRLTTTGYALVLESLFEVPFDVGCIVYVRFADGRVLIEREFHAIDDEVRQMFIEQRDEKMRLVSEQIDPGLPAQCPSGCAFLRTCYPVQALSTSGRPASANRPLNGVDGLIPST